MKIGPGSLRCTSFGAGRCLLRRLRWSVRFAVIVLAAILIMIGVWANMSFRLRNGHGLHYGGKADSRRDTRLSSILHLFNKSDASKRIGLSFGISAVHDQEHVELNTSASGPSRRNSTTIPWFPSLFSRPKRRRKLSHDFPEALVGRFRDLPAEDMLAALTKLVPYQNFGLSTATEVGGEPIISSRWSSGTKKDAPQSWGVVTIPKERVMEGAKFNSCAVVASSGGLLGSKLGAFIDSHDAVVRFNDAPTPPSQSPDIGVKATVRFLNNVVMQNPDAYLKRLSSLFNSTFVIGWDACRRKTSLLRCLSNRTTSGTRAVTAEDDHTELSKEIQDSMLATTKTPEEATDMNDVDDDDDRDEKSLRKGILDGLRSYFLRNIENPDENYLLLSTDYVWQLWEFLQSVSPYPISGNTPSTGFVGFSTMLHLCDSISLVEFVPSRRALGRPCHYYNHITKPRTWSDLQPVQMASPRKRPFCKVAQPGAGWHPHHAELAVMLRLAEVDGLVVDDDRRVPFAGNSVGRYDGVLTIPVRKLREARRMGGN